VIPDLPQPVAHRRVAVIPIVLAVLLVITVAVATAIVVTLASSTDRGDGESSEQELPAVDDSADSASPTQSPIVPPTEASSGWRCVDYTYDVGSLDIASVVLDYTEKNVLTVAVSLVSEVPEGEVQVGIIAARDDGERVYQFTASLEDRDVRELISTEFTREDRDRLDVDDARVDGNVVEFVVPRSIAKRLGDDWSWSAFSSRDGSESDACPGLPGSGEKITFKRADREDSDDD